MTFHLQVALGVRSGPVSALCSSTREFSVLGAQLRGLHAGQRGPSRLPGLECTSTTVARESYLILKDTLRPSPDLRKRWFD